MHDVSQRLAEIAALWNSIERRAKEVEQFRGEAIIACINEMRYAGRRIVDVIHTQQTGLSNPDFDISEQLAIAKNFLYNADHDLTDAVLFYAHKRIHRTIAKHGAKKVAKHCPEFAAMQPEIDDAHRIVTGSRQDRIQRKADYERLATEYVPKIMALHKKLEAASALRIDSDIMTWWLRIVAIIAFVGSVASVIGVGLAIWGIALIFNPPAPALLPAAQASTSQVLPPS